MVDRLRTRWRLWAAELLGAEDTLRNAEERSNAVRYFSLLFIPGAILFGSIDLYLGRFPMATLLLSAAAVTAVGWQLLAFRRVAEGEVLVMVACTALGAGLLYDGGMVGTGTYWILLYPFLAFFVRGQRRGWKWIAIFLLIAAVLIVLHTLERIELTYSNEHLFYFFGVFFFFTLLAAGLNLLRRRYERLLEIEVDAQSRTALGYLERLEYLALYDPLTDLPNRHLVRDRIGQAIADAKRASGSFAVALLDIERFHEINTLLGHQKADTVLKMVAGRLRESMRGVDTVARLEGDEFMIVWPGVDESTVEIVVDKIQAAMEKPFELQSANISLSICMGAVIYPQHGDSVSALTQHLYTVHRRAKAERLLYLLYQSEWHSEALRRIHLLGKMRNSIEREEMQLAYQPQVSLADGSVRGAEALLRWQDPEEGFISPGEFVPLAEQSRLIEGLTLMTLAMAARQNRQWRDSGMDIQIAVNLSARNLIDLDLPDKIDECLQRYQGQPHHFKLEITETDIMEHPDLALAVMQKIDAMGMRLSIDDFGTGYSSLTYLRKLPVEELKIDRAFIRELTHRESDRKIVASVLSLAHALNMSVVAEGVETPETWEALQKLGIDKAQGYLISHPLPSDEFVVWLNERQGVYKP